jgi:hypothetical protein
MLKYNEVIENMVRFAVERIDYNFGEGKRTPVEKRQLRKYYKKNRKQLKKERRKLERTHSDQILEQRGGKTHRPRKQRKNRDYPNTIRQPERRENDHQTLTIPHKSIKPIKNVRQIPMKGNNKVNKVKRANEILNIIERIEKLI